MRTEKANVECKNYKDILFDIRQLSELIGDAIYYKRLEDAEDFLSNLQLEISDLLSAIQDCELNKV